MPAMKRRSRGFTMMELLVTLAVAGVLLGLGVPAFRDFMRNGRLTGAANELLITMVSARNEAVRRQLVVSVCPSTTPDQTSAVCSTSATQGYIAFIDTNSNCLRDGAEVADVNNVVANVVFHSLVTAKKNSDCISFAANGFRRVVGGTPATMHAMFCDVRGNTRTYPLSTISYARGLEVMPTGRASTSRVYTELVSWGTSPIPSGERVTCP
jgi:type IV fimbrial biogenesis protein FimT